MTAVVSATKDVERLAGKGEEVDLDRERDGVLGVLKAFNITLELKQVA